MLRTASASRRLQSVCGWRCGTAVFFARTRDCGHNHTINIHLECAGIPRGGLASIWRGVEVFRAHRDDNTCVLQPMATRIQQERGNDDSVGSAAWVDGVIMGSRITRSMTERVTSDRVYRGCICPRGLARPICSIIFGRRPDDDQDAPGHPSMSLHTHGAR